MNTPPALEQRLLEGYRAQLTLYDQAMSLITAPPGDKQDWAEDLHGLLGELAQRDREMAADKAEWRQSNDEANGELTTLITEVAQRITNLSAVINQRMSELQSRRDQLVPEVDEFIRRRRMIEAYGKYGDRQTHVAKLS